MTSSKAAEEKKQQKTFLRKWQKQKNGKNRQTADISTK